MPDGISFFGWRFAGLNPNLNPNRNLNQMNRCFDHEKPGD
jgi:hypothetical protein